jgi:hypothetical protein
MCWHYQFEIIKIIYFTVFTFGIFYYSNLGGMGLFFFAYNFTDIVLPVLIFLR